MDNTHQSNRKRKRNKQKARKKKKMENESTNAATVHVSSLLGPDRIITLTLNRLLSSLTKPPNLKSNRNDSTNGGGYSPSPPPASAASASASASAVAVGISQYPNWLNLPSALLDSILKLISASILDLLAFSSVCTQWRSLAKSTSFSYPPLLLCSLHPDSLFFPPRRSSIRQLKTLNLDDSRSFQSLISESSLKKNCVGYSHGHLIFVDAASDSILIADVFSRNEFYSPKLSSLGSRIEIAFGILTAPPTSPSCMLILVTRGCAILLWQLDEYYCWSVFKHEYFRKIHSLVTYDGLVFGLLESNWLLVLEFTADSVRFARVELELSDSDDRLGFYLAEHQDLVEINGELFLVLFVSSESNVTEAYWPEEVEVAVYQLDFSKRLWVEVQSIGDWCLFKDKIGRGLLASPNPSKWGGRNNCLYVAGPSTDSWSVFTFGSPLYASSILSKRWPSPVWVYPSMLL